MDTIVLFLNKLFENKKYLKYPKDFQRTYWKK